MPQSAVRSVCKLALFVATTSAGALVVMSVAPAAFAVAHGRRPATSPSSADSAAPPAGSPSPSPSPSATPTAVSFKGTRAVGGLFTI